MTDATTSSEATPAAAPRRRRFSCLQVLGIVGVAMVLAVAATLLVVKLYVFPSQFRPVKLSDREEQALDAKLERLEATAGTGARRQREPATPERGADGPLEPEPYSEEGASREIVFSEKEVNALIARNTDLANRLAIDLSDDLISAKLLVPMDDDFPVLGGRTVRIAAGVELAYAGGKPRAVLRGVSIMGVPLPNAWLGNLKNVDLVREFGDERGIWSTFAAGVETIEIRNGRLRLRLKE